jgi:hypothetical protein
MKEFGTREEDSTRAAMGSCDGVERDVVKLVAGVSVEILRPQTARAQYENCFVGAQTTLNHRRTDGFVAKAIGLQAMRESGG